MPIQYKLTQEQVDTAEIRPAQYKIYDAGGLLLVVSASGSKLWRYKYRYLGKEDSYSIGSYPTIGMDRAREIHHWCREQLAVGINPNSVKRDIKAQQKTDIDQLAIRAQQLHLTKFSTIAGEWYRLEAKKWSVKTMRILRQRLTDYIYPAITRDGVSKLQDMQIADITTLDYLPALRKIEEEGKHETAHRVKDIIGKILRYSVATRNIGIDTTYSLKGMLLPVRTEHHQAIVDPQKLVPVLKGIWEYHGRPATQVALKLGAYLYKRSYELRYAQWSEIKWDVNEWHIPGPRMKMKQDHIVPLPTQAVELFLQLKEFSGSYQYVFPNDHDCTLPMSNGAIRAAMLRMGYQDMHTEHGWRATAKTILEEVLGFDSKYTEMSLAHLVKDPNGQAYGRMAFLAQRKNLMQVWADYLDNLRAAQV